MDPRLPNGEFETGGQMREGGPACLRADRLRPALHDQRRREEGGRAGPRDFRPQQRESPRFNSAGLSLEHL